VSRVWPIRPPDTSEPPAKARSTILCFGHIGPLSFINRKDDFDSRKRSSAPCGPPKSGAHLRHCFAARSRAGLTAIGKPSDPETIG